MAIVYLKTNLLSFKGYVGQTWRPDERQSEHRHGSKQAINRAVKKHPFDTQVLATCRTQEELDNLERIWIILLRTRRREFGYNLTSGGKGFRHNPETKARIGAAARGNRYAAGNTAWLGRTHTPETRAKLSASAKLRIPNRKGAKFTPEQLARLSAVHQGQIGIWKGKKLSAAHCQHLREAWVRRKGVGGHGN